MRVLIIIGSPRKKGNSHNLLDYTTKELTKRNIPFDVFDAGVIDSVHPCLDCGRCNYGKCFYKDPFSEVVTKFQDYTDVIWITPIYFFQLTAQSKMCLDRLGASPYWKDTRFYLFVVSGSSGYLGGYDIIVDTFKRIETWHKCRLKYAFNKVTHDKTEPLTIEDKQEIQCVVNMIESKVAKDETEKEDGEQY